MKLFYLIGITALAVTAFQIRDYKQEEPNQTPIVDETYDKEECKQKPILLVETKETDVLLHLNKEAQDYLKSPELAGKLIIPIFVVGPARTGKSFFLNTMTKCFNLFEVGHEEESKTKGAWMFLMDAGEYCNNSVFGFIDTEGINSVGGIHDRRILQFSGLTAAHIIYHMEGKMQKEDLKHLDDLARLMNTLEANHILETIKTPTMTGVVDKFVLEKKGEKEIKEDESEEDEILKEMGIADNAESQDEVDWHNNVVRRLKNDLKFKRYLVRPAVSDSSNWRKLNSLSFSELDREYLISMDKVRNRTQKTEPKVFTKIGEPMTTAMFAEFLEEVVEAVNNGDINGNVDINPLLRMGVHDSVAACSKLYHHKMVGLREELPLETRDWERKEANIFTLVMKMFERTVSKNNVYFEDGVDMLESNHNKMKAQFHEENVKESEKRCEEKLKKFSETVLPDCFKTEGCFPDGVFTQEVRSLVGPKKIEYREKMRIELEKQRRENEERQTQQKRENEEGERDDDGENPTPKDSLKDKYIIFVKDNTLVVLLSTCVIALAVTLIVVLSSGRRPNNEEKR